MLAHWQANRSPRVLRTHFLPIYPSHLLPGLPDDYRTSDLFAPSSRPGCLYALRIPRARDLPTASFRPRLTAAALAVQLTVPVIRVRRGLSPPSECALPGAQKKRKCPYFSGTHPICFTLHLSLHDVPQAHHADVLVTVILRGPQKSGPLTIMGCMFFT